MSEAPRAEAGRRLGRRATIDPQRGDAFVLRAGETLKIIDPQGGQVADFFCFDRAVPTDGFSASRTIDYNDTIRVTTGHILYSGRSQALAVITRDTCGRHDLLMTPCSRRMFQLVAGDDSLEHPSCHDNLARGLEQFGYGPDQIATTFNVFMNVEVAPDGGVSIHPPMSSAGDSVELEALRDLYVGLTACSHEESNGGRCKPVEYEIWFADPAKTAKRPA